ncbi:MAG: thiamine-phosphate kinase [Rikenellaceae bacterium]
MDIAELGEFKFIEHITRREKKRNKSTLAAIGDDAAVLNMSKGEALVTTDLMVEGLDFDLTYTPMKHLGYKSVVVAASDICAMGGVPTQILISLALSKRFTVEMIDEFYDGVDIAANEYKIDLVGGDTSASLTGFMISTTCLGSVAKGGAIYRSGAHDTDLICVSGDLGSAYIGMKLFEREKKVLSGNNIAQPEFGDYTYLLSRALKPTLRTDIIKSLAENSLKPTSMIDISDGLASEILHICKKSNVGAKIFIDRLPIVTKSYEAGEELGIDPIISAMNGGGDYELMFTLPVADHEKVLAIDGISVVGYITPVGEGVNLVTAENREITIKAQGHK